MNETRYYVYAGEMRGMQRLHEMQASVIAHDLEALYTQVTWTHLVVVHIFCNAAAAYFLATTFGPGA